MIDLTALFHVFHESLGIGCSIYDSDTESGISNFYFLLSYSFVASYFLEFHILRILSCKIEDGGPKGCFHDSASVSEYDTCARGFSQRRVEGHIRESVEVYSLFLCPEGKFPCGYDAVHVTYIRLSKIFAGGIHLASSYFHLLCCTWSQGHVDDLLWIQAHSGGEICLDCGSLHSNWTFCRRKIWNHLRHICLHILDPCRTAGGELGENTSVLYSVQKLAGFFADCKVGREIGVQHIVYA